MINPPFLYEPCSMKACIAKHLLIFGKLIMNNNDDNNMLLLF